MKFAKILEEQSIHEWAEYSYFSFISEIERQLHDVEDFYVNTLKATKEHIGKITANKANQINQNSVYPSLFASASKAEDLTFHGSSKELYVFQIEELQHSSLRLKKLESFARMNLTGFRKAVKKFDKRNNLAGPSSANAITSPKLGASSLSNTSEIQQLHELIDDKMRSIMSHSTDDEIDFEKIRQICEIWNEIYEVQIRNILERDELEALKHGFEHIREKLPGSKRLGTRDIVATEKDTLMDFVVFGACHHGAVKILDYTLALVGDASIIEKRIGTSLIEIVIKSKNCLRKADVVEVLLHYKASATTKNRHGEGLIHICVANGTLEIIEKLLFHDANVLEYDFDDCTPLYYAISKGDKSTVGMLLEYLIKRQEPLTLIRGSSLNPLILASKRGHTEIISLLLDNFQDINSQDKSGETALYHSVRRGFYSTVLLLLQRGADPNLSENIDGLTPLAASAINGSMDCARVLIDFGACRKITDVSGWFPFEHAVFRGFLTLGEFLKPEDYVFDRLATELLVGDENCHKRQFEYGHDVLSKKTQLRLSFGHLIGPRAIKPPLEILDRPLSVLSSCQLKIWSVNQELLSPHLPLLPISCDGAQPITITLESGDKQVASCTDAIIFDIIRRTAEDEIIVARGTFVLYSVTNENGKPTMSGAQRFIVPLTNPEDMKPIALLSFEAMIVKPFMPDNREIPKGKVYWKAIDTVVIGHRGFGANTSLTRTPIGENTVLSFITAASLGAGYVEFDVQVTRDKIPVLYHDFIFHECGLKVPIGSLTMEEFLKFRDHLRPNKIAKDQIRFSTLDDLAVLRRSQKKWSIIESPFATLEEAFLKVPEEIGFNVEVKYPSESEKEAFGVQYTLELNEFCDAILKIVFHAARERPIIFSSFHPDVCLLLSLKQASYPVFFLTNAGTEQLDSDPRRRSLSAAIKFAKTAELLGIVSNSSPLLLAPRLVRKVKGNCLMLFTYGALNNQVDLALLQKSLGVDAVIVDSVVRIRKGFESC